VGAKRTQHVTMKDIAIATGYSVNTVSHALKDREDISKATKEIVKKKAKELGYLTNQLAVSMRSGVTHTIALIIPDIANPFFSIKVKEIDVLLRKNGYHSIIINTDENSEIEYDAVCSAIGRKVDGIIICPTQKRDDIFSIMNRYNVPFVLLGRQFHEKDLYAVVWNDNQGGFLATEYLIKLGKKNILYINGPSHISSSNDRLNGYKRALEQYHITLNEDLVIEAEIAELHTFECLEHLTGKGLSFDGIFAFSDFIAFSCIESLSILGISVPVVGFDDILSGINLPISIASIGTDKNMEAQIVIDMIFEQLKNPSDSVPHVKMLETYLVNRTNN